MNQLFQSLQGHSYEVIPPGHLKKRRGMLLKATFSSHCVGFADLMAWPELGDKSLIEEISDLTNHCPTALGFCALRLAKTDGIARQEKKSLWKKSAKIPESHYLIGTVEDLVFMAKNTSPVVQNPQQIIKIKWTPELAPEHLQLLPHKFRIDFNERGTTSIVEKFLHSEHIRKKIDFLEDPFSASQIEDWRWLKNTFSTVRVFGDYALSKNKSLLDFCDGMVFKPTSREMPDFLKNSGLELCVTHGMGHPLGHMTSAWYASEMVCTSTGLDPLPKLATNELPIWNKNIPPFGQGFGFETSDLEKLHWQTL